ncbi:MaoC family dehydratase N-terminal domain-containing protein [Streptomyces sp. M10(2022)]
MARERRQRQWRAPQRAVRARFGDDYEARLQSFAGRELNALTPGPDPVNRPMIRHWAEAMGDTSAVYTDDEAARAAGREGVVAPASMIQAWTMRGYDGTAAPAAGRRGFDELVELLDRGGYTSVVATDSELEFRRELVPGDQVSMREVVESVSAEKRTGLGAGRFVTTLKSYVDQDGRSSPPSGGAPCDSGPAAAAAAAAAAGAGAGAGAGAAAAAGAKAGPAPEQDPGPCEEPRALRPRPAVNRDNAFWFDAARRHRLLIQRCTGCSALRHPPGPCCPRCNSLDWDTVEASGRGHVYSFVVNHHPRHPAFDFPMVVAVIELVEGTRLITNLTGLGPQGAEIGMPVVLDWLDADPDLSLPVFRPAATEAN